MEKLFTKSRNFKEEYCCSIVKIEEVTPIENSDFLGRTIVNGLSMVIRKDEIKEGDVCIYAANETELNANFLGANNLFDQSNYEKNANSNDVYKLLNLIEGSIDETHSASEENYIEEMKNKVKTMCGFFNNKCRVKMIRLKGTPSFGFLFKLENLLI